MIYVDAREGLSGDMLLAAMIGLLKGDIRNRIVKDISRAARAVEVDLHVIDVDEERETGLGISYTGKGSESIRRSYNESSGLLDSMRAHGDSEEDGSYDKRILDALFQAEANAHHMPVSEVHIHEVGRASALANMYGIGKAYAALKRAGAGEFVCSTIVTGKGIVVIAHGAVRVPAPACRYLLEGLRHETGAEPGERATPTGIAAVKVLASSQSDDAPQKYRARSIGFGTRRFGGRLGRTILIWP